MARVDSRRARRMMKQMGMKMDELKDIEKVILQGSKREIIIEGAQVTSINVQGQKMYQIAGGKTTEKKVEQESKPIEIPEEDILLVAQQANVSLEKAKTTLEQVEGDLARAILMLQN
jgi:nascent polypeptide-associated complex subunit alpha